MDLVSIVAGTWGWKDMPEQTCADNPHGFDLDIERQELTIRYGKPTRRQDGTEFINVSYKILEFAPQDGSLLLSMEDEKRVDSDGNPVLWRMRFIEFENSVAYIWERPDAPGKAWGPFIRCAG